MTVEYACPEFHCLARVTKLGAGTFHLVVDHGYSFVVATLKKSKWVVLNLSDHYPYQLEAPDDKHG